MRFSGPKHLLLFFILFLTAGVSAAQDVRWGRPPVPTQGACFYKDIDFQGEYFCVRAGQDSANLPAGFNDRIYSIRIFGRAAVTVFVDGNFRGPQETLNRSVRDLRNFETAKGGTWGGRLSSFRVAVGSGPDFDDGACFFKELDYRGESFCMKVGQNMATLPNGFNDRIQSMRVTGNARVVVFVDSNFRDTRGETERDYPDLYEWKTEGGTWSRRISSIRIVEGQRGGNWPARDRDNDSTRDNPWPRDNDWPRGGGWAREAVPNCQEAIRRQLIPRFGGQLDFAGRPDFDKDGRMILVRGRANYRDGSGQRGEIDYRCTVRPNGNIEDARYTEVGRFRPRH